MPQIDFDHNHLIIDLAPGTRQALTLKNLQIMVDMLVKCIYNKGKDLPLDAQVPRSGFGPDCDFRLILDKMYIVYGMTVYSDYIWYYIGDEYYSYYPAWNPSPLFEVIDGRLSKYWVHNFWHGKNKHTSHTLIAYPEWANEPYYYDQLTDGEEREVEIFESYKALMDLEFPNPSIIDKAKALEGNRLECPSCLEIWETTSRDGMVICPNCEKMLHNPFYENNPVGLGFEPPLD